MNSTNRGPEYMIAADVPSGYYGMPLSNIGNVMEAAEPVIAAAVPDDLEGSVPNVIGILKFLLEMLATKNAVYCGIGRHVSSGGEPITSWLTVSSIDYGRPQNPRLVIRDLVEAKLLEAVPWVVETVDIAGRPALFAEGIRTYPAPNLADAQGPGDSVPAFQIEGLVPSDDGTTVAVIELSTTSVSHGPEYRPMVFTMAASLEFADATSATWSLDL
ncbi:hypothetical protein [Nocardia sp. NBC_01009]|uniref:hypothetical protein n=1 Tax=Nocardia sp. NBC_01009 TaxID=2975996 RepID=UPI00386A10CA|nr:hypothetical protein OHA42_33300 [Nocardia sp. NBC_01009]